MWKLEGEVMMIRWEDGEWSKAKLSRDDLQSSPEIVECDANGTPLSELPADRITLAEFDAFAARVRANLAKLEEEEAR